MSVAHPKNLTITDSIIETLRFPQQPISDVLIKNCQCTNVYGISDRRGLPAWAQDLGVENFESVTTVSAIKNVKLDPNHRVLVTILKKTYLQKGNGRQEEALVRGLGQIDRKGKLDAILNLLLRQGFLEVIPGDHGRIFIPVAKKRRQVAAILAALNLSTDELWRAVSEI